MIFTERLTTLAFLQEHLPQDLGIPKTAIAALDGSLPDTEQMAIVKQFGQRHEPVRILIATEVASEGLNLHYLSHKLIHFEKELGTSQRCVCGVGLTPVSFVAMWVRQNQRLYESLPREETPQ